MDEEEEIDWVALAAEVEEQEEAEAEEAAATGSSGNRKRTRNYTDGNQQQETPRSNVNEVFDLANVISDPGARRQINEALDRNIVEMNNRFCETSTRLLKCTACLDPRDSFSNFDHEKLVELANIYSVDFSSHDCYVLTDQLNIYIDVMKRSPNFLACDSLSDFALKLVQNRQHLIFPLVYRLITLALTLPVATTSVERVFSAMNIIKTYLRNKIGDDWLNGLMICYVEKELFAKIDDKKIMLRFHSYKNRRGHLPRHFRFPSTNTT